MNLKIRDMKKLIIGIVLFYSGNVLLAQNEYKTEMKNSPDSYIEIQVGTNDVKIIGHDSNEIIITTNFAGKYVDEPTGKKKEIPDRASGLKPISVSVADNTGIGLVVDKDGDFFSVLKISKNARSMAYMFKIPNKAKLIINDINAEVNTTYFVDGMKNEVEVTALNSQIKMENITGPVVATSTNGNIEIRYSKITPEKPNSIVSVNGYVDVTLPAATAADLQLNTVNGEAYTDWDIKVNKETSKAMPVVANMNMFNIEGSINGGGIPISIQSVNGDIYLRKKK